MLSFEEVDRLLDEATEFLLSCRGVYQHVTVQMQENILFCLVAGQYIISRGENRDIDLFLYYWNVMPEDEESIFEGCQPVNRVTGTVLYIVGYGNRSGMKGMRTAIKELRRRSQGMSGLIFNHKGEGFRSYPHQKGA